MCSFSIVLGVCLLSFSSGYSFKLVSNAANYNFKGGRFVLGSKLSPLHRYRKSNVLHSTLKSKPVVVKSKKPKKKKFALDWYLMKSIVRTIWNSTIGLVLSFIVGTVKGVFKKKQVPSKDNPDMVSRTIESIKSIAENDETTVDDETIEVTLSAVATPVIVKSDQIKEDGALAEAKEAVVRRLAEIKVLEDSAKTKGGESHDPLPIVDSYTATALDHAKQVVHFSQDSFEEETDAAIVVDSGDNDHARVAPAKAAQGDVDTVIAAMKEEEEQGSGWEKIKSAGKSGVIAYVLTELSFWTVFPLLVVLWQKISHQSIDLTQADEQAKVLGYTAGFVTMARAAVPARIALALAIIPFVDKYVNKNSDCALDTIDR